MVVEKVFTDFTNLKDRLLFETTMGSCAYGANTEKSDKDFYGVYMPEKHQLMPHLAGEVVGFNFKYPEPVTLHTTDAFVESFGMVDVTLLPVVKFFELVAQGNSNVVDSLFVNDDDVLFTFLRQESPMDFSSGMN